MDLGSYGNLHKTDYVNESSVETRHLSRGYCDAKNNFPI